MGVLLPNVRIFLGNFAKKIKEETLKDHFKISSSIYFKWYEVGR